MEQLPGGLTLDIPEGCFPLSTDSMVLADFIRLRRNARVLDLGSGCGTLGLLLCASDLGCHITGIELDGAAHAAAQENIRRNRLEVRMESICADLRDLSSLTPSGSFSCCVSNPPYFSAGFASKRTPLARREDCCGAEDLMKAAAWALQYGGDLFLVHRPERLADLIARAAGYQLEAKRLLLVRHRPDSPTGIIALQFRKGGSPGLQIEEATLFDEADSPTPYYRRVYHLP